MTAFYNANRFLQLLTTFDGDGYGVVLKLMEKDMHYDFKQLWEKGNYI